MATSTTPVFVDPFLLIITLIMVLILILGNMYFVAHYSHHADSFFGSSSACKAIIVSLSAVITYHFQVVGYIIAECQVLILPLDMANTEEKTNFHMMEMWYIVFMSSLFYMCVVLPFGLFYSETDEEKEFVSSGHF